MSGLIGHAEALGWLGRGLAEDRLSHAYLITGQRGVGRRTFALEIARALNCEASDVSLRPCGECRACRLIGRGVHPDVTIIRRPPERRMIHLKPRDPPVPTRDYVDYVEFLHVDAQLRPAMGRAKVYVIVNAEELAPEAANYLLKSIEEPTRYVYFLLSAAERGGVAPTIASRCQEIRLRPVGRVLLSQALVERGQEPAVAEQLAALAGGSPGWALAAARDPKLLEQRLTYVGELVAVLEAPRLERMLASRQLGDRWSSQNEAVRSTLRAWLAWWRDVLLVQLGLAEQTAHVGPGQAATLGRAARELDPAAVRAAQLSVQQTLADLDANVNARLALDIMLLRFPSLAQPVRA